MDELFAKYERELVTLRQLCREYAEGYPKVAAKLLIGGDAWKVGVLASAGAHEASNKAGKRRR